MKSYLVEQLRQIYSPITEFIQIYFIALFWNNFIFYRVAEFLNHSFFVVFFHSKLLLDDFELLAKHVIFVRFSHFFFDFFSDVLLNSRKLKFFFDLLECTLLSTLLGVMFNNSEAKFPIVIDRACPADLDIAFENHGSFRKSLTLKHIIF